MTRRSEEDVQLAIIGILDDMVEDFDIRSKGKIGRSTRLAEDLAFDSVDIIHLVVAIEEHFGARSLGFAELLMRDGRYVDDVSVDELAKFVSAKLAMEPT